MRKAIINARIYDFKNYIENGFVLFDKQIIAIGAMKDFKDEGFKIIDGSGQIVMPSLVCGHAHIYSTFARGLALPFNPKNFQEILDQLWWKIDRQIDNETTYYSGIVASVEFMKNGVTTIIDHHASGKDITGSLESLKRAVCDQAHLRGIFAFEVSDRFDIKKAIAENHDFIEKYHTPFTAGLFGLHASMSLSENTLKEVKNALGKAPIHIHVAESEMDEADCAKRYQETIVARLERHGLLNPGSILVHSIHVDANELEIIRKHDCRIAINVNSNTNNAVGLPNLKAFRENKIKIILGNDGLSSSMTSEYLSVYYLEHLRENTPIAFGLSHLLDMIEDTYAYAGGMLGVKLGKLEPGYEADLLMIPYQPPTAMTSKNAFGHLFFGLFNSFKPKNVFVAGRPVVKNYEVTQKTLTTDCAKAKVVANRLWDNIRNEEK
jgi:cytosine/adenosine deaminase-related metal-dependent hydrolase